VVLSWYCCVVHFNLLLVAHKFIISVTKWNLTSLRRWVWRRQPSGILRLVVLWKYTDVTDMLNAFTITLNMEAVSTSKMSVSFYDSTQRNIPESCHLNIRYSCVLMLIAGNTMTSVRCHYEDCVFSITASLFLTLYCETIASSPVIWRQWCSDLYYIKAGLMHACFDVFSEC
jgi:hypothetical protein